MGQVDGQHRDDPDRPDTDMGQKGDRQEGEAHPNLATAMLLFLCFPGRLLTGNILFLQETVPAKEFTN